MSQAIQESQVLELDLPHEPCNGSGLVAFPETRIKDGAMAHHMKHHANTVDPRTKEIIGANCDCPRRTITKTKTCIACAGKGIVHRKFTVPSPGDKMDVIDVALLEAVFEGEPPEGPGRVYDTQTPDQHQLELRTGLGVRLTWDNLTKEGGIPKGQEIQLWTFDLSELRPV